MSNLFWLSEAQMDRLRPFVGKTVPRTVFSSSSLLKNRGRPRVDDRRVLIGTIFINRNGLRWCDAPSVYGPPKPLHNRWKRWCDAGVFARIMAGLASEAAEQKIVMIDATYLKARRTASSLAVKKGI